ncbi:acyl-CoA dehydrogenase family protein [Oharaeibacter diazotrophicus]|uniref:Acyl-CoA dehydrogenase n=1 Tax=Oharaeibacter diazotrophicus TaxID=1920512 RepID=A0A4R6RCY1_9HYPH|nr:acyl-CoA dehydrogenase family protein [Oharaeibacter diazotrophicus]TDP83895.1 acyl-CoA dehydrogenase [Oharaeibacter diazotrophicus]BBE72937.1 putative acyl-CoA dehydrogenase YdbM [Pleomorphomonas sp. SM30]GLS74716.1 acyl-CoA dehydrogenase [Oharaeibacter diazotrophicus]
MNAVGYFTKNRLAERAKRVAAVAATFADAVDAENRFPKEAVEAMKLERLMGVMVPVELGGEGASTAEIADACSILGQSCGASAMIFAMHQIKMSSLVEHGAGSDWHRALMRRICAEQLLMGSATTEAGIGGNMRNSICAIEVEGDRFRLEKNATVISYALECDGIMVTSRAHRDAPSGDQVMTVVMKDQYTLEKTHTWDTLGMRGTRSDGFVFRSEGAAEQILPVPFAEIAAQSMLAHAHILWGALWYGIAADAVNRAHAFVRGEARRNPGVTPPGAVHLAEAMAELQMVKSALLVAIDRYEEAKANPEILGAINYAVDINLLKVAISTKILEVVDKALLITGINGYKNGTPFSLGRHLRDAHSARLMISNDRVLMNTASLITVMKQDASLLG